MDPIQPPQYPQKSNTGLITGVVAVILIGGIAFAAIKFNGSSNIPVATVPVDTTVPPPTSTTTPADTTTTSKYKDGTYSADGSYLSPGGNDTVQVTLTLKDDVITDATVVTVQADPTSTKYENMFISAYKQYVIGVNIDQLNVTKVSGSSLTSKGFNDAVSKIKVQAEA